LVDADYYGYRDDEDGLLIKAEAAAESLGMSKSFECDMLLSPLNMLFIANSIWKSGLS
jgi:hypothetical protein